MRIEELWIKNFKSLRDLGIRHNHYLQKNFGYTYRKSMLSDFADKVDSTKLSKIKSFIRFMKALEVSYNT